MFLGNFQMFEDVEIMKVCERNFSLISEKYRENAIEKPSKLGKYL